MSLGNLVAKQNELKAQVKKMALDSVKPSLEEAITDLQRLVPGLTAVRWRQYTPYFNDGDECVFSIGEKYFNLGATDQESGDYEDGFSSLWSTEAKALSAEAQTALKTFSRNLNDISDLLKTALGDHAKVTLSATGIEVTEYDHE